jgi:hypothetical protein
MVLIITDISSQNNGSLIVYFTNTTGTAVTNLQYTLFENVPAWINVSVINPGNPFTISQTQLSKGVVYSIQIRAKNIPPSSPYKISSGVRPDPPTNLSVRASDGLLLISFTAGNNGGFPITGYKYNINGTSFDANTSSSPIAVTTDENGTMPLTNGKSYQVTLQA